MNVIINPIILHWYNLFDHTAQKSNMVLTFHHHIELLIYRGDVFKSKYEIYLIGIYSSLRYPSTGTLFRKIYVNAVMVFCG